MLRHKLPVRFVASVLILGLFGSAGTAWAGSGPASLTGRVISAGSGAPLTGWTVLIGNPQTRSVQSSTTTNADGTFAVRDLPPATYEVAVQSSAAIYPANGSVRLAPGQARDVQVAVNEQQKAPPPGPPDPSSSGGASWWSNPVVATLAVVGGAVLIGIIVDNASDDSQSASPSAP